MGGNTVLIGPNGWPIIWITLFMSAIGWWLYRSSNNLPLLPPWVSLLRRRVTTDAADSVHNYIPVRHDVSEMPRATPGHAPVVVADDTPQVYTLSLKTWLERINNQPDRVPHVAASGPSGSGKTTLILAALHHRPGRFVIVTPKSRRADPWGGLPVIRLRATDMSFEPIGAVIDAVYDEMLRRNAEDADVTDDWLTLVIDEYSTVIGKLPDHKEKVLDMVTLGRSSRIRIIILATETNVKAWGWEGRGEARHNVLFIECEEETHRAVMYRWGKDREPMDTRGVPEIAANALSHDRWWNSEDNKAKQSEETHDHQLVFVATLMGENPDISQREVARRLWPHTDGGGSYAMKAGTLIKEVTMMLQRQRESIGSVTPDQNAVDRKPVTMA